MKKMIINRLACLVFATVILWSLTSCDKNQTAGQSQDERFSISNNSTASLMTTCAPIPDSLRVPDGNKLMLETFAEGVQIYEVKRSTSDPNAFVWVNIAPFAKLFDKQDLTKQVINHFAGPTWQFIKGRDKGESVVARKTQGVTVDATAIQWLLLETIDDLSSPDNRVTFVQRICTEGGLAPESIPTEADLGKLDSIPYHASYLFYEKE
jgi:hypothetical protein